MDIRIENLRKSFGEKMVLSGFSHTFPDGTRTCILGSSGCGKTTLLRLIAGLEVPDSGAILGVKGKKISAVFQEDRLFMELSAERNVLLTARSGFTRADARALLRELGLEPQPAPVRGFSGGMRRRVAIARALAADYDLLLLDEPCSGLDGDTRAMALAVIRARSDGRAILCVSHDATDAERLDAQILRLNGTAR